MATMGQTGIFASRGSTLSFQWAGDAAAKAFVVAEPGEDVGKKGIGDPDTSRMLMRDAASCSQAILHSIGTAKAQHSHRHELWWIADRGLRDACSGSPTRGCCLYRPQDHSQAQSQVLSVALRCS